MLATVIHKPTKQLMRHVETTKLSPITDYIINPPQDVINTPPEYWVISGDTVRVMNAGEIAAIIFPQQKTDKLQQLEDWWITLGLQGISITYNSNTYIFDGSDAAFNHLVSLYTFSKAAVDTSFAAANKTYPFIDRTGTSRNLTAVQIANILARYGTTRLTNYNNYTQKRNAINAATNKAALDAIII